jgi:hypothetical protein
LHRRTQVRGVTPGSAGLDDVIKPSANSGTFYLSDTKDNRVLAFHVTGLNLNDYYASVGSLNAFGQIDPTTGNFTALVNAADAPGFSFGSPHGVAFVPDAGHGPLIDHIATLGTAPAGTKSPDSITVDSGFVWAAYTNGADSTGKFGHSTIVEYDQSGSVVQSYNIAGYVDGLKLNPVTGDIWALQNQDGNSKLAIIDPVTHKVSEFTYAHTSATRGYDDVAFENGKVFLSYTNPPGTTGNAVIVELTNGNSPSGPLKTTTVLTNGIRGYNTETGTMQSVPLTDPDSLKVAPNGDLLLTNGDGGVIVDVQDPGGPNQAVAFTQVQGVTPGSAGLDDVIKPSLGAGTFYLADTKDNRVLAFHVTGPTTTMPRSAAWARSARSIRPPGPSRRSSPPRTRRAVHSSADECTALRLVRLESAAAHSALRPDRGWRVPRDANTCRPILPPMVHCAKPPPPLAEARIPGQAPK